MTPDERTNALAKIRDLPDAVEGAVRGLDDRQLDTPYREGGWTVRQVVHHLADSHLNAFIRMKLLLTEDRPTLKPYDQDDWAGLVDSRLPVAPSLAILRGLHERWAALIGSLPESAWSRTGYHPERGDISMDDLLGIYAGHGEKHVEQIRGLRRARGW